MSRNYNKKSEQNFARRTLNFGTNYPQIGKNGLPLYDQNGYQYKNSYPTYPDQSGFQRAIYPNQNSLQYPTHLGKNNFQYPIYPKQTFTQEQKYHTWSTQNNNQYITPNKMNIDDDRKKELTSIKPKHDAAKNRENENRTYEDAKDNLTKKVGERYETHEDVKDNVAKKVGERYETNENEKNENEDNENEDNENEDNENEDNENEDNENEDYEDDDDTNDDDTYYIDGKKVVDDEEESGGDYAYESESYTYKKYVPVKNQVKKEKKDSRTAVRKSKNDGKDEKLVNSSNDMNYVTIQKRKKSNHTTNISINSVAIALADGINFGVKVNEQISPQIILDICNYSNETTKKANDIIEKICTVYNITIDVYFVHGDSDGKSFWTGSQPSITYNFGKRARLALAFSCDDEHKRYHLIVSKTNFTQDLKICTKDSDNYTYSDVYIKNIES
jgi:hypothetical protein